MEARIFTRILVPSLIYLTTFLQLTHGSPDLVPLLQIPSTNLSTGIFYTITMKSRPSGVITWTDQHTSGGANYLQIDLTPGRGHNQYKPGGVWYHSSQFIFTPLPHVSTQFLLRNRYDLTRIVASHFEEESGYNFVTWDQSGGHEPQSKSYLTPIGTGDGVQLQFSRFSRRFLTWAPLKYGNYSYYLQVAPTGSEYNVGGTGWNNTIFKFSPVTEGVVLNFGVVGPKHYSSVGGTGLGNGEMVTVYKETFQNPGPFPTINVVKTLLPDTSGGVFILNNAVLAPHIRLSDNFTISLVYNNKIGFGTSKVKSHSNIFYTVTPSGTGYTVKPLNRLLPLPPRVIKTVGVNETLEFSVRQELFRNVELPFTLTIPVGGEGDRVLRDNSGVARGPMPPDVVLAKLSKLGVDTVKETDVEGDQVFLKVGGVIKGVFLMGVETIPPIL